MFKTTVKLNLHHFTPHSVHFYKSISKLKTHAGMQIYTLESAAQMTIPTRIVGYTRLMLYTYMDTNYKDVCYLDYLDDFSMKAMTVKYTHPILVDEDSCYGDILNRAKCPSLKMIADVFKHILPSHTKYIHI